MPVVFLAALFLSLASSCEDLLTELLMASSVEEASIFKMFSMEQSPLSSTERDQKGCRVVVIAS